MKPDQFCSGTYLLNMAADGLDYPEQAPLRWKSGSGEPLAQPKDQPANSWATLAPLTFHEAALSIVRSHHINTENL